MWNTIQEENKDIGGLWTERINPITGESSLREHTPKVIKEWCLPDEHYFVMKDPRDRILICDKCKYEAKFVLGMQKLIDGKLVEIIPNK